MKTMTNRCSLLIAILLFTGFATMAQKTIVTDYSKTTNETKMKTLPD